MSLRELFTDQLKLSMKAGNAARTSTLRMIMAKLKDTDIASRSKGIDPRGIDPRGIDPRGIDPRGIDPRGIDPRSIDPRGIDKVSDEEIVAMLRGMVKSRRESMELYTRGNRPELAAKEEAEIGVIESFLPSQMDEAAIQRAVGEAVAETSAVSIKDMGKVMAALKAKHAASLDMAKAGPMVKARLSA